MKSCPSCGFANNDSARFCKQCGKKLDIQQKRNVCAHCGKELSEGAMFCRYCGSPVAQAQNQQNPIPPNQRQQETSKPKGSASNHLAVILGVCLAVVIIAFAAFIALSFIDFNDNTAASNDNGQDYAAENDASENDLYSDEYDNYNNDDHSSPGDTEDDNYNSEAQNNSVEQETEETEQETESGEYILPTSDSEYLTKDDLAGLTAEECRLARNEIYARHGRMFQDEELQSYFDSLDWYQPAIEPDDFQESMLNEYEVANRDLIIEYETEQGYR